MPEAIHTVDKINKLHREILETFMDLTERANENEVYFWAHVQMKYRQVFDTDVDKGANVGARAKPGNLPAGIDVGADGDVGARFEKSRDGVIEIEIPIMHFYSNTTLLYQHKNGAPDRSAYTAPDR